MKTCSGYSQVRKIFKACYVRSFLVCLWWRKQWYRNAKLVHSVLAEFPQVHTLFESSCGLYRFRKSSSFEYTFLFLDLGIGGYKSVSILLLTSSLEVTTIGGTMASLLIIFLYGRGDIGRITLLCKPKVCMPSFKFTIWAMWQLLWLSVDCKALSQFLYGVAFIILSTSLTHRTALWEDLRHCLHYWIGHSWPCM